jgi:tetratricopeptide (TPR) repeat protein
MRWALGLAIGLSLLIGAPGEAQGIPRASVSKDSKDARILAADQDFKARKDDSRAQDALSKYRAIWSDSGHRNVEAGWKLAMTCYFTGHRLVHDSDSKERIFREGADAAEEAAKLSPTCAACEFWAAIDTALLGETVGVFKMISSLGAVKDRLQRVIELDPGYAYGGAYRLLGLIEQRLPGILGGDNDRAREYFEKAIEAAPDEPLNYLFMARLMANDLGDPAQAESYALRGLQAVPADASRIESFEALKDLRAFLEGLRESRRQAPAGRAQSQRQGRA